MLLSVYCSGSIIKSSEDRRTLCWTDNEKERVQKGAGPHEVIFLNPDDPITDPANTLGQFGRDMFQVMTATAVIVDARERRGIGVGVEMAAAATMGTPLIVVAARNTQYRADSLEYRGVTVRDYVHPHVASLATAIVDDFLKAGEVLANLPNGKRSERELPTWLEVAISEYRKNVFPGDQPMVDALASIEVESGRRARQH